MKKTVLTFGLAAGAFITTMMIYSTITCYNNTDFRGNMVLGYAGMLVAFSFIFLGIKSYRDKYLNGTITFGKAFKAGLYMSLVASSVYVGVWLVEYYVFIPDFMEKYTAQMIRIASEEGPQSAEAKAKEMAEFSVYYKNPLFVVIISYVEVLPIALVITLISSFILKGTAKGKRKALV